LSYPNGAALLEEALQLGADVVGAIPHFEFTREYGVESPHIAFELAQKYDRPLDIHCDEIDDEQSRFVETVAALALKMEMGRALPPATRRRCTPITAPILLAFSAC
jgi:cytosine deaminase